MLPGQERLAIHVCREYWVTINTQLETHEHPIPNPEDLMCTLGRGYGFSKIDSSDAYNQVQLAPESQKQLVLSTQRVFCCKIDFHLASALCPASFKTVWKTSHRTILELSWEELLRNLKKLLQCLGDSRLHWRLEKCQFPQATVEYLGSLTDKAWNQKGSQSWCQ